MPTPDEQSQQQMTNAWMAKVDAMWEAMEQDVKREQEYADGWKALGLRQAEQNQQIVNRLAQDGASVSATLNSSMALASSRGTDAAAALQNLILAAALGQQITANKMSAEVASADVIAKKAIDAAIAAVPGTGAPAQGTTGTAQGGIQTVGGVAAEAIMGQITKLAEVNSAILAALAVLNTKVAALEVAPKPT